MLVCFVLGEKTANTQVSLVHHSCNLPVKTHRCVCDGLGLWVVYLLKGSSERQERHTRVASPDGKQHIRGGKDRYYTAH